jgi:hypothetical protein
MKDNICKHLTSLVVTPPHLINIIVKNVSKQEVPGYISGHVRPAALFYAATHPLTGTRLNMQPILSIRLLYPPNLVSTGRIVTLTIR